jgi:hypothetical protein
MSQVAMPPTDVDFFEMVNHAPAKAVPDHAEWKRRWHTRMEVWDDNDPIA